MALATYANLIDGIRDWLARPTDTTTLPDTRLADLVVAAETEIYDRYRGRDIETSATVSTTAQSVALPSDFLELRRLYLDTTPITWLTFRAPSQFWYEVARNTPGRPRVYTIESGNIIFGPIPDATYTGRMFYYQRPAAISASFVPTLFTNRPTLYLYGALAHAAALIGADERLPLWRAMFEGALENAQKASDRAENGASPLMIRPG